MNEKKIKLNASSEAGRLETLGGIEYYVVPAVMLVEMVIDGLFYRGKVLARTASQWNGRVVTINHPYDGFTANEPGVESQQKIGTIYNARFEDKKLKADLYLETNRFKNLGKEEVLNTLKSGITEVSTGLFVDITSQEGIYNNIEYTFIVSDIQADHLAILPNDIGACDQVDGCGAGRLNELKEQEQKVASNCNSCKKQPSVNEVEFKNQLENIKNMNSKAENFIVHNGIRKSEESEVYELISNLSEASIDFLENNFVKKDKVNIVSDDDLAIIENFKKEQIKKREINIQQILEKTNKFDKATLESCNDALLSSICESISDSTPVQNFAIAKENNDPVDYDGFKGVDLITN